MDAESKAHSDPRWQVYETERELAARVRELEEQFDALADDALALLDLHISEEQRKELGIRIIERLTQTGKLSNPAKERES